MAVQPNKVSQWKIGQKDKSAINNHRNGLILFQYKTEL